MEFIPQEIFDNIFSQLDYTDVKTCASVSKNMRSFALYNIQKIKEKYIKNYKNYLINHPQKFFYNVKENIYIVKISHDLCFVYDVILSRNMLIFRRGFICK